MQTISLSGLLFETADSDELNYRAELRDAMLRAIGNSRFAIYHHLVRRRASARAKFPTPPRSVNPAPCKPLSRPS